MSSSRHSNILEAVNLFVNMNTLNCFDKSEKMKGLKVYVFSTGKGEFFIEISDLHSILLKMLLKNFSLLVMAFGHRHKGSLQLRFWWPSNNLIRYSDKDFVSTFSHCKVPLQASDSASTLHSPFKQKMSSDLLFWSNLFNMKSNSVNDLSQTHSLIPVKKKMSLDGASRDSLLSPLNKRIFNSFTFASQSLQRTDALLEDCLMLHCDPFGESPGLSSPQFKNIQFLIQEKKKEFLEKLQNREGLVQTNVWSNLITLANDRILEKYPQHAEILSRIWCKIIQRTDLLQMQTPVP